MARWSVLVVVSLLASGCLVTDDGDDQDGAGTASPTTTSTTSAASTTSTSVSSTYTPPPPLPPVEWDPGSWVDAACPAMQPIMAPYFFHDLAVRNGSRIVVLRGNADSGSKYAVHAEGAEGTRFLAASPGAVYAAKDVDLPTGRVVQYDDDLNEVRSVQVGEVGSLHRYGDTLYVGGLGRFTALSLDLAVKDVLEFDEPVYRVKRIDYIAIQNGVQDVAFLVDDVVMPFRLYRVDVTDPGNLRELGNHTVHSSTSPGPQWIDFAAKQWYVGTNFYGRGPDGVGYGESATAIGLEGAAAEEAVSLHSGQTLDSGRVTESGYDIAATTWYLPGWAVLQGNGARLFAHVAFKDGIPSKACDTALGQADGGPAYLAEDYSWFVVAAGNHVWYIDHTRGPSIARSQSFPFGITGLAVLS